MNIYMIGLMIVNDQNNLDKPINNRIIFQAVIISATLFSSYVIREVFGEYGFVNKLLGGINIFLFWGIMGSFINKLDYWIFVEFSVKHKANTRKYNLNKIILNCIQSLLLYSLVFYFTLEWLNNFFSFIVWLLFLYVDTKIFYQKRAK